jgi:hypothetical protein
VPLPGDAESHFFLSHAQSTGGDQTNAIYLELKQLGFTCWYVTTLHELVSMKACGISSALFALSSTNTHLPYIHPQV